MTNMHWPLADRRALQEFALQNAWSTPIDVDQRAFRQFPGGWAVAISVNR